MVGFLLRDFGLILKNRLMRATKEGIAHDFAIWKQGNIHKKSVVATRKMNG